MPELPEVETIVCQLRKKVLKRTILGAWSDWSRLIKRPSRFSVFTKEIKQKRILKVQRQGKNIIFELSGGYSLLIHQKLTGHLLYGKWQQKANVWQAITKGPLQSDSKNRFLHFILFLDNDHQIALSDLRKFARIELWKTKELTAPDQLSKLGPDALSPDLTLAKFKQQLKNKRTGIKKILMDQTVLAGIGNIYSDEILFSARVHPKKLAADLTENELKSIYQAMKSVLKQAIKLKGTSISDYRTLEGKKGEFGLQCKVYQRQGLPCFICGTKIKQIKINNRSAHFCSRCQIL